MSLQKETVKKTTQKGLEVCEVGGFQFARKRKSVPQESETATSHTDLILEKNSLSNSVALGHSRATVSHSLPGLDVSAPSPHKRRCSISPSNSPQPGCEDIAITIQANLSEILRSLPSDYPLSDKLQAIMTCGLLSSSALSQASPESALAGAIKPIIDRFAQLLYDHINEYKKELQAGNSTDNLALRAHPALLIQLLDLEKLEELFRMRLRRLEAEAHQWDVQRSAELCFPILSPPLTPQHMSSPPLQYPSQIATDAVAGATSIMEARARVASESSGRPSLSAEAEPSMEAVVRDASAATVESIASLMDRARGVMRRADDVCKELQADLHRDLSAPFQHINSPAWLIRNLSQAPPPESASAKE